jgi:hypothetical protein
MSKCSIATFLVEEHGHEERGKELSDGSRARTNFGFFDHRMGLALRVTAIVLDGTDEAALRSLFKGLKNLGTRAISA